MLSVHLYAGGLPLLRTLTKILWDSLHCCVPPACRALCIPGFRRPVMTVTKMTASWLVCSYNSTLDKNHISKGVTKRVHKKSSVRTSAETRATLKFHVDFFRKMLEIIPRLGRIKSFFNSLFICHLTIRRYKDWATASVVKQATNRHCHNFPT